MAATRVQNVTASQTAVAAIAIGSAQGWVAPTAGNLIVAWYNGDNTCTISAGFTAGPSVVDGNGVYFWYKVAAVTDTTVTFTQSSAGVGQAGLLEYGGMAATPFDVQNASPITTGTAGATTPAVSVTGTGPSGDLIVALAGLHASGPGTPTNPAWTGGLTNIQTAPMVGSALTASAALVGDLLSVAAGAVSTAASWTGNYNDRQELVMAFKLAAGGAAPAGPTGPTFVRPN